MRFSFKTTQRCSHNAYGILLGSTRRRRGRQSSNESQEKCMITIALCAHDSNTITSIGAATDVLFAVSLRVCWFGINIFLTLSLPERVAGGRAREVHQSRPKS